MENPTPQQVQEVKERVMQSEGYLHIKQAPKQTVAEFLSFANSDEWCGHWGLAFKHVWDFYTSMNPRTHEAIMQHIEGLVAQNQELVQRIERLEQSINTTDDHKTVRVMADGTLRKVR